MTVRDDIEAQIKADNPNFIVKKFPDLYPENLGQGRTYVQIYRTDLEKGSPKLTHAMKVTVIVALQDGNAAEDALEGALDQVLLSLQRMQTVNWTKASRAVVANKWNAYEIDVTAISADPYKAQVLSERA